MGVVSRREAVRFGAAAQNTETEQAMEQHKRRKRYSGTHPRTFEEKYKEHDPERYAETVAKVISKGSTPAGMHISIMVNEVLEAFLNKLPDALADGGRVAILTFHSGEDRLVKKAFQEYYRQHIFAEISQEVIRPSAEECRANGRARSTKLRWAVKS